MPDDRPTNWLNKSMSYKQEEYILAWITKGKKYASMFLNYRAAKSIGYEEGMN